MLSIYAVFLKYFLDTNDRFCKVREIPDLTTHRRISMGGVTTCLNKSSPLTTVICSKTSQVSGPPWQQCLSAMRCVA